MGAHSPTVIATYRVRADRLDDFLALLRKHWPALRAQGLVTDDPPVVYQGGERDDAPIVFEIFTWKTADSARIAHENEAVQEIWGAMGPMCEERKGRPMFSFPHVERVEL